MADRGAVAPGSEMACGAEGVRNKAGEQCNTAIEPIGDHLKCRHILMIDAGVIHGSLRTYRRWFGDGVDLEL